MMLRPYQEQAVAALKASNAKRKLLVLPTGAGKTVVFSHYIREKGVKTLVVAHRREIVQQGINAISAVNPESSVGMLMAQNKDFDSDIIFASIQTLAYRRNLERLPNDIGLVIVDEGHHATANTYKRLLYRFGLCDADTAGHENVDGIDPDFREGRELLGVTATPRRTDKVDLDECFDELTYQTSIVDLIPKYLVDFRAVTVQSGIDLSDVDTNRGELNEEEVADAMVSSDYLHEFPRVLAEHAEGRNHILVFLPNVRTTEEACDHLNIAGISAGYVTGKTPKDERAETLSKFANGELRVLCNCMILTEGVDIPSVDAIVMARPTKSATLMIQMVGRGFRKAAGKKDCLLIDLAYERRQNDLISVASAGIFGDLTDVHLKHTDMSMMELIQLQKARAPYVSGLLNVVEQRKEQVAQEEEVVLLPEEEVAARTDTAPPYFQNLIPEDTLLLMDTAVLRKLCASSMDMNVVWKDLVVALRRANPYWRTQRLTENQYKWLVRCGFDSELLSDMNKADASAIIGVLKTHEKPTLKQINMLRYKFNVATDAIPKTLKEASNLIDKLFVKQGELPFWAR